MPRPETERREGQFRGREAPFPQGLLAQPADGPAAIHGGLEIENEQAVHDDRNG